MEQTTKPSTLKALLMCILACLGGGLVFGIIYYLGYYIYYITVLEIVFGVLAFLKFKQSTSKGNIAFAMILSTIFVILFNFLGVILCEALVIATDYSLSFSDSLNLVIELWKTDPETTAYFNTRIGQIAAMALIGCIFAIFIVISNVRKKKQQNIQNQVQNINSSVETAPYQPQPQQTQNIENINTTISQTQTNTLAQNMYFEYYSQCKQFVNEYLSSKDMTTFKQQIDALKQRSANLDQNVKDIIKSIIISEKNMPNVSSTDQKTLQILERMFG